MPNRILREAILDSCAVNSLSPQAELFYRRLMSVVDDFGRFDARPSVLRSRCYPLTVDKVREADISRWMAECQKAGLIALYDNADRQYLLFFKLGEPRAKSSKYPPPLEGLAACAQMNAGADICSRVRPNSYSPTNSPTPTNPPTPQGGDFPRELDIPAFRSAWEEWCRYRKRKRKPVSEDAEKKKLKELAAIGPQRAVAAIQHSIANDYQGIFEPSARKGAPNEPSKRFAGTPRPIDGPQPAVDVGEEPTF
jgi:hypothetical protein